MEMLNELEELNWSIGEELIMQDLLLSPWKSTEQKSTFSTPSMNCNNNGEFDGQRSVIALPEKGMSTNKMENKFTLRIKTFGNGVADDGYKWRKYGQKSIKNSPNPRSYYRCTNPKCSAKRQVERSTEDPNIIIITYEGLHLHYTYSHILHSQSHDFSTQKKPKKNSIVVPPHDLLHQDQQMQSIVDQQDKLLEPEKFENSAIGDEIMQGETLYDNNNGLLEDIVPLMVRKPCCSPAISSNEPSHPSQISSPSYSSSLCWTPETFHFAEGVLSSIV